MNLLDSHLKQALKNAPDHDQLPDPAVRQAIMHYARQATMSKSRRWLDWFPKPAGWQVAGFSSAVLAMLALVMVRTEYFGQPTATDIAQQFRTRQQAELPLEPEHRDAAPAPVEVVPEKPVAQIKDRPQAKGNVATQPWLSKQKPAKTAPLPEEKSLTRQEQPIKETLAQPGVLAPVPLPSAAAIEPRAVQDKLERRIADTAAARSERDRTSSPLATSLLADLAQSGGQKMAQQDQAGGLQRILAIADSAQSTAENCRAEMAETPDEASGYRVWVLRDCVLSDGLRQEVERYNREMRAGRSQPD